MLTWLKKFFPQKSEEAMETREYISPLDAAVLELQIAERALNIAQSALEDFQRRNSIVVNGELVFSAKDVAARAGLERERHGLLVAIDAAHSEFQRALAAYNVLRPKSPSLAPRPAQR